MKNSVSIPLVALGMTLLLLSACGDVPSRASYANRGGPESLIDVSSETVKLSVVNKSEVKELAQWIAKDRPTKAELQCHVGDKSCAEARKVLELQGVPVAMTDGDVKSVTLVYERILARDCNQSYVDNPDNFYNTNHSSFGCSVAANMVQHVTDKQEFVNPSLSDDPSAVRAVNDMHRAYTPRDIVKPYAIGESFSSDSKSTGK